MANLDLQLPLCGSTESKPRKRRIMYLKLIDLYSRHECLWMESHKDFFNFELKESVWEEIANEMKTLARPNTGVDKWKNLIVKLRYKVQMQKLREQEAKFNNQLDELPPKLCYADQFEFLLKHRFDKKEQPLPASTIYIPICKAEELTQGSLAAKCMRLGREKPKAHVSFSHKLRALENIRNRQRSTLTLSPEAYDKLKA